MRGFARALASAAAIVAHAIFGVIGVVGMAGTVFVADVGVILGALIDILDDKRDGRAGGQLLRHPLVLKHAGENFHRVGFLALGDELRLAGTAAVEIGWISASVSAMPGRAAIDHAANRRPMAFAEGRDAKQVAECVVRHGVGLDARLPRGQARD